MLGIENRCMVGIGVLYRCLEMCGIRGMSQWVVEDISASIRAVVIDLFTYLLIPLFKSFSVKRNSVIT